MVKCLPTIRETRVQSLGQEDPLEKEWQPILVLLPGKSHGQRSLVGYSPQGRRELDTAERLSTERSEAQTKRSEVRVQVPGEWRDHGGSALHVCSSKPSPREQSQDLNHPAKLRHAGPVIQKNL